MTNNVEIFLDNYNNAFYPGQTIAGRIECNFDKEKNLRSIRIKFKGRAETEWNESERYYDHSSKQHKSRNVRYSAEEVYFEAEYNLVQGGENFHLPQGKHTYPFSYILPQQLPSSFEGSYGNVRYYIKAVVDRPWKFDYEGRMDFNLISPLDLNYIPRLREPLTSSVDKNMCCCWCKSGPLSFDMSLPITGYVPGQEIHVGAYVQNMSNVSAESVKFKIRKNLEYIARYPSTKHRYEEDTVVSCREGGIGAHGEKSWTSKLLLSSNQYYPNLTPCSIINISYSLFGEIELPCPHTDLDMEFPISIGTVAITGVNTQLPGAPSSIENAAHASVTAASPSEIHPLLSNKVPLAPDGLPFPPSSLQFQSGNPPPYPPSAPGFADITYPEEGSSTSNMKTPEKMPYPAGEASAPPGYDEAKAMNEKNGKF